MPGAGSAEVAFRVESGFNSPGAGDWIQPGMDITVTPDIDNELTRNRQPDDPTPARSRTGNFVGTVDVSFTLTDSEWHALIPDSSGSLSGASGIVPTAEWYFDVDALNSSGTGTFNQSLTTAGTAVTDATVNYQEGEVVTVDLTLAFGHLSDQTPGTIVSPAAADVFTHHGVSLSVDTVSASALQTMSLSLNSLARRVDDQSRNAFSMVAGAMSPELSADAIFTEADQLKQALGGSTTSIADRVSGSGGTITLENGNGDTITYALSDVQPTSYAWNDLVNPDTDLTESIQYHVSDVAGLTAP
jgi:hypothetical protein